MNVDNKDTKALQVTTTQEFDELVAKADGEGKLVVIDFFATWCGPCKNIAPIFAKLSKTLEEKAVFLKVDVDVCEEVSARYKVTSLPTFIIMKNSVVIDKVIGSSESKLVEALDKATK